MEDHNINRRSFVRKVGAIGAVGASLPVLSREASATSRITITVESNGRGAVDYALGINSYDVEAESSLNPLTSISRDRNHDTTTIWGGLVEGSHEFSMPGGANITYIEAAAPANTDEVGGVKIKTDADTNSLQDWDKVEVRGYEDNGLLYEIFPVDEIDAYEGRPNLERDDKILSSYSVPDIHASGEVQQGGIDEWKIDGHFKLVSLIPRDGKITIDRKPGSDGS